MSVFRVGLLSTAKINNAILAGAARSELVDIVAVGSRDAAKGAAYAAEKGLARSHGSYEALLADAEVDAVYVSLPNGLHHEWTLAAIAAGKHVLCEKPYTRRPAEVDEAFDAAEAAGVVLMEALMYRHHPQISVLRSLIDDGAIGRLRLIKTVFSFPLGDLGNIRAIAELDGGALMDVGCYVVSGARLLGGEPQWVHGAQLTGSTGVDMTMVGAMGFAGDVLALFDASFSLPERQSLEAVGEGGSIFLEAPWRADLGGRTLLRRDGAAEEVVSVPEADSYQLELENLAAAARGEAQALLGRADALGQACTIEAIYRSAAEGRRVSLR